MQSNIANGSVQHNDRNYNKGYMSYRIIMVIGLDWIGFI